MIETKTYSQYAEDIKIQETVAGIAKGRLLDLGAWNPTIFSNTRALIEQGWTGVLVECSPGPARSLIREYDTWPGIEVVVAAVGFSNDIIKFHATDDAVSTSDPRVHEIWKDAGGYYGSYWTPQIKLEDLMGRFGANWDFINFDTEGSSAGLFIRALELGLNPKCVCVEHDGENEEIERRVKGSGYKTVLLNGTNMVMAR